MSKSISSNLKSHFSGETTTIAVLVKITRRDATVLGFTNHDVDIVYDSVTYVASSGFLPTDIQNKDDLSVDNLNIFGVFDSLYISEEDLLAGLYDYAEIKVMMINYENTSQGVVVLKLGWLDEVVTKKHGFEANISGLAQKIQQTFGEIYTPNCRANLGDSRCGINIETGTLTTTTPIKHINAIVSTVVDRQTFYCSGLAPGGFGLFVGGYIIWTSGDNVGLKMEVKEFNNGNIVLALPMPYTIDIGDVFTAYVGCDKTRDTCKALFNNLVNFRGEHNIPGMDKIYETSGTFTTEDV